MIIGAFVSSTSAVDFVPKPGPYRRQHVFPCWVSSASSGRGSWLSWRVLEDAGPAGPISGARHTLATGAILTPLGHHRERNTVQHGANRGRENPLDMRYLQARGKLCDT